MNNQNTIYVEYSQYTKLKEKYEKILKEKNEYKKILKETSANLAYTKKTHELIKNSVQAVQENFKTIMANNTINNNGTIGNTINAFSTSATNSFETLQPKLKVFLNNSNRKLEDIENAYNELVKSFNFLVVKYKKLKEENIALQNESLENKERYEEIKKKYENYEIEMQNKNRILERTREVGECIENIYYNSLLLNSNKDNLKEAKIKGQYIRCEPVPTFVKFLKNLNS